MQLTTTMQYAYLFSQFNYEICSNYATKPIMEYAPIMRSTPIIQYSKLCTMPQLRQQQPIMKLFSLMKYAQ